MKSTGLGLIFRVWWRWRRWGSIGCRRFSWSNCVRFVPNLVVWYRRLEVWLRSSWSRLVWDVCDIRHGCWSNPRVVFPWRLLWCLGNRWRLHTILWVWCFPLLVLICGWVWFCLRVDCRRRILSFWWLVFLFLCFAWSVCLNYKVQFWSWFFIRYLAGVLLFRIGCAD